MKLIILLTLLIGVPNEVSTGTGSSSSEIQQAGACRLGILSLDCNATPGFIKIQNSMFGAQNDTRSCDWKKPMCEVTTEGDQYFHMKIMECAGRSSCVQFFSGWNEIFRNCPGHYEASVKVSYCCVSDSGTLCEDRSTTVTTISSSTVDFTTPINVPHNTTAIDPGFPPTDPGFPSTTKVIPPSNDNTAAIIGGTIGGLAGGGILVVAIIFIIKKCSCENLCKKTEKSKENKFRAVIPPMVPAKEIKGPTPASVAAVNMSPDYQNYPNPNIYYIQPGRDVDSHHYQAIQLPTEQPYYNVYSQYDSIGDVSMATEVTENDSHYEEIDNSYLGLYGYGNYGGSSTT